MLARKPALNYGPRSRALRRAALGIALLIPWCDPALAQTLAERRPSRTLRWQAPPGCPNEQEFLAEVHELIATDSPKSQLEVQGLVRRISDRFELTLTVREGALEEIRHFTSSSCAEVTQAGAVAVALLLQSRDQPVSDQTRGGEARDPRDGATSASTESAGSARVNAAAARSGDDEPDPQSTSGARPAASHATRGLLLFPGGVLDYGALPFAQLGVTAGGGIQARNLRLLASAEWWPRVDLREGGESDRGAHIDRARVGFEFCYERPLSVFIVAPCATLGLEYLRAEGFGMNVVPSTPDVFWLGVGAGLGLRYRWSRNLMISTLLGAELETSRPLIRIEGAADLGQVSFFLLRSRVGVEWFF